jgi:DNA-binding response OmpR family regulator
MISGFDAAAKDVALENGADIYLEKPFTRAQIYQSIETLLKPDNQIRALATISNGLKSF